MKSIDCMFIGSSTRDMMMLVEAPPESDQRIEASQFVITFGGVSSTAGIAFHKLGGRTGIVTAVGQDETARHISQDLLSHNLAYLHIENVPGRTSSTTFILVERNGKRCMSCYGGCIQELSLQHISKPALARARFLHLGVLNADLMYDLSKTMKEDLGGIVSIDGGNLEKPLIDRLLPVTDYFICDHKTARKHLNLSPQEACEYFIKGGAAFAAVTSGEEDAIGYDGRDWYQVPAYPVDVLDTTGAGDNYHGAFVYGRSVGWGYEKCMRFASVFASLSCRGMGGREKMPNKQEVLDIMEQIIIKG